MMKRWIWGMLLLGSFSSKAEVWETTQSWTAQRESEYRTFIQSINIDFCTSRKMFSFCSATAYQLRATFAAKNGLPFLIHNYAKKKIVTNESKDWDSIPEKSRIDAFIRDIARARMAYSGHIAEDVFAIHPQEVRSGDLVIEKGHVRIVKNVRANGLIDLISTTEDDEPQELWEEVFTDDEAPEVGFGFFRFKALSKDGSGIYAKLDRAPVANKMDLRKLDPGFDARKWIGPEDAARIEDEALPFFFRLALAIKISLSSGPTYLEISKDLIENIDFYVGLRNEWVRRIGEIREHRPLTVVEKENFSTHSRDRRFAMKIRLLLDLAASDDSLQTFFRSLQSEGARYSLYSVEDRKEISLPKFKVLVLALAQQSTNPACSGHKAVFTPDANDPSYLRWPFKHFGFTGDAYAPALDRACVESLGIDANDYFFK